MGRSPGKDPDRSDSVNRSKSYASSILGGSQITLRAQMATEARLLDPNETSDKDDSLSIEAYRRGFSRCLVLRNTSHTSKYSEQFKDALHAYFDSYGLLNHPKLPSWWSGLQLFPAMVPRVVCESRRSQSPGSRVRNRKQHCCLGSACCLRLGM